MKMEKVHGQPGPDREIRIERIYFTESVEIQSWYDVPVWLMTQIENSLPHLHPNRKVVMVAVNDYRARLVYGDSPSTSDSWRVTVDPHQGTHCPGTMRNGPDKGYTRCRVCERVDYETNEGDRCPYPPKGGS